MSTDAARPAREAAGPDAEAAVPHHAQPDSARTPTRAGGRRRSPIQAKLVVGASDDPAEREADAVADRVSRFLAADGPRALRTELPTDTRISPATASRSGHEDRPAPGAARIAPGPSLPAGTTPGAHSPGVLPRISRLASVIGSEGGSLDAATESQISAARGRGAPLDGKIRRRMETAMGADFSNVRVHVGAESDALNERIQARAFTTGADVFVRRSDFAPETTSGQRLLAHELAHTVQQGAVARRAPVVDRPSDVVAGSLQRSGVMVQRWPWSKKQPRPPMEISGPLPGSGPSLETERGWAADGRTLVPIQPGAAAAPAAAAAPWKGKAGATPSALEEAGKGAGGFTAAAGGGAAAAAASGSTAFGAPGAGAALGPVLMADAAIGLRNANAMYNEGAEHGDSAMKGMGTRKAKDQGTQLFSAGLQTSKAGVDIANLSQLASAGALAGKSGADLATAASATTAGVAGAGLGIATGSVMVVQGAWRGGKAVMKLCRLTWGRGAKMFTSAGERWKKYVQATEGLKIGINALKITLGALAIAGSALLIASNPIGWAIGIAAAVGGGIYAISKVAAKYSNAKDKQAAAKKLETTPAEKVDGDAQPAERDAVDSDTLTKRKAAIEQANKVARDASTNATVAGDMRAALLNASATDKDIVQQYLDVAATPDDGSDDPFGPAMSAIFFGQQIMASATAGQFHDALQVLSSINVSEEEATADSGQDFIEKKLSLAESA